jgi:hypothetical protein
VTRPQAAALVIGVVAIFGLSLVAGVGRDSPVQEGPRETETGPPSSGSELGRLVALVGAALVGAVGTHLFQQRRERQRSISERDALWTLVRTEMLTNTHALQGADEMLQEASESSVVDLKLLSRRLEQGLSVRTWEDVRVRLAELLSRDDFYLLINYYLNLQGLLEDIAGIRSEPDFPDLDPEDKAFHVAVLASKLRIQREMQGEAILRLDTLTGEQWWPEGERERRG